MSQPLDYFFFLLFFLVVGGEEERDGDVGVRVCLWVYLWVCVCGGVGGGSG